VNATWERAVRGGDVQTVRQLFGAGSDVNARDRHGQTALMLAASEGHVNIVRNLVLAGADINVTDEDKMNALAHAADNDHAAVVRFLKSKGSFETVAKVKKEEEE